ncbi:MAG: tetratricopeptide repeat protein [Candidatus Heimdallarchaeaceae archaeon]
MGIVDDESMKGFQIELIESLIDNQLFDEALPFLERMMKKYTDPYFIFLRGKIYYLTGKFKQTIEELTSVIAMDSDFWKAYELLGETYRSTNKTELAETYYFKATSLNPRAVQSWLGRGKVAMLRGENQVAVLCFETYLRSKKKDSEVWRLLARSYNELSNPTSAMDAYNEAITIDPTNQLLYEELGDLYQIIGREDLAQQKYLEGLQVEEITRPVKKELYYKLARLYLNKGDNQKAFNVCNELLASIKDNPEATFLSGKALIRLGQRYEGITRIKRAIENDPQAEYKEFLKDVDREIFSPR